jgi:hypothetical protein
MHIGGVPFERVLTFPFRGSQSIKRFLLVAGLILASFLVPILPGVFCSGYMVRILRRAIREGKVEMPDWSDGSRLLADGFYSTIISLAYLLPGVITLIASLTLYFISFLLIMPSIEQAESSPPLLILIPMIILTVGLAAGFVFFFLGAIPLPLALCRFADEERLGAAFQIGKIFRAFSKNPAGYVIAWVVSSGLSAILYFLYLFAYLTIIFCCPGYLLMLIGSVGVGIIFLTMVGLAYRQGKAGNQTEPVPAKSTRV